MAIEIKNLSFRYQKNLPIVLDDLSLTIEEGDIVVLLGLNGCGKTTLIKSMAGLIKSTLGDIYYNNKRLEDIKIQERSRIFSYVPQRTVDVGDFAVKDYLTYGFANTLRFYQSPSEKQLEQVKDISDRLNITKLLPKKLKEISGGERQIITIASCLLQNTSVILLDEPTSALDFKNQSLVLSTLWKTAQKGKTIILSSHNPNHALFMNSKVALMNEGKIVAFGPCQDIITKDKLSMIYGDNICYSNELPYQEVSFTTIDENK